MLYAVVTTTISYMSIANTTHFENKEFCLKVGWPKLYSPSGVGTHQDELGNIAWMREDGS